MTIAFLYYRPFWHRAKLNGPWAVYARIHKDWTFINYFRSYRRAWFHLLVSWGWRDYEGMSAQSVSGGPMSIGSD